MKKQLSLIMIMLLSIYSISGEAKQKSQLPEVEKVAPLPNSVTLGGLSIAIAEAERVSDKLYMRFAFRRVSKNWSPKFDYFVNIFDDRGNVYQKSFSAGFGTWSFTSIGYPDFMKELPLGFTWSSGRIEINIPEVAPIQKVTISSFSTTFFGQQIPDRNQVSIPLPELGKPTPISFEFKIEPEQSLLNKEIKLDKNLSFWINQPKSEVIEIESAIDGTKTALWSVNIPITIKNDDYNSHSPYENYQWQAVFVLCQIKYGIIVDKRTRLLPSEQVPALKTVTLNNILELSGFIQNEATKPRLLLIVSFDKVIGLIPVDE